MKRHRLIYGALKEELDGGVHALALQTKTPSEVGVVNKSQESLEEPENQAQ